MSRPFDDVLDECIERLLRGDRIEDCLARYPDQAAQLEPLLRVAGLTARAAILVPRPEFRAAARERLAARVGERRPIPIRARSARSGPVAGLFSVGFPARSLAAVAAVLLVVFLSSGALVASANSLPGERLYPVKITAEQVQLVVAADDAARAQLHAEFAERRLAETEVMLARPGQVEAGIAEAAARKTEQAAEFVERQQPTNKNAVLQRIAGIASRQESVLSAVIERAPAEAKPGLERALEASRRGREKATRAIEGPIPVPVKPEATPLPTAQPTRSAEPDDLRQPPTRPVAKPDDAGAPRGEATRPAGRPDERAPGSPSPVPKPIGKPDDRAERPGDAGRSDARETPTPTPDGRGRGDDRGQHDR